MTTALPALEPARTARATAIDVAGVSCRFKATHALAGVDLAVGRGEVHAVLGPNGAGKTTLLRVIIGLQQPHAGRVRVLDRAPALTDRQMQRSMSLIPSGSRSFYLRISGLENLLFFARLNGLRRAEAVERARSCLRAVGLDGAASTRVGLYSNGMQKRLAVARALLTSPEVLVVDEATHDLDPQGAQRIRTLIGEQAERGAAVVWATQRLDEIRGFAHRVTVLHAGRVRFQGTVPELVASTTTQRFLVRVRGGRLAALRAAVGTMGTVDATADSEHYLLGLHDDVVLGRALAALTSAGVQVLACREEQSLVEAALLRLTGEEGGSG